MRIDAIIRSIALRKDVLMALTKLEGSGWLRTRGFASSTAVYEIFLRQQEGGSGAFAADGTVLAEVATMVEARYAKRAVLVLASGDTVSIDVVDMTPAGLTFHVTDDVVALVRRRG